MLPSVPLGARFAFDASPLPVERSPGAARGRGIRLCSFCQDTVAATWAPLDPRAAGQRRIGLSVC